MKRIGNGHMTLGDMIARYEAMPLGTLVEDPGEAMSARAVYAHVGFAPCGGRIFAREAAEKCRSVIGKTFTGYKGGDFTMSESSPVWIAQYGISGDPLLDIDGSGELIVGGEGRMW